MDVIISGLIGLVIGFIIGMITISTIIDKSFDGEYDRAHYEWKLKKEKQNGATKN